jgi:hypothetical protein
MSDLGEKKPVLRLRGPITAALVTMNKTCWVTRISPQHPDFRCALTVKTSPAGDSVTVRTIDAFRPCFFRV